MRLTPFCPRAWDLPFTRWRADQRDAIERTLTAPTRYVVLQCPTGFGKSLVAAGIMAANRRARSILLTSTKSLQSQYGRDFPDLLWDMRGMGNYECLAAQDEFKQLFRTRKHPPSCSDGPCHSDVPCSLKERGCLYFDRYRETLRRNQIITSYAYLLSTRRYSRGLGPAPLLLCDEAHATAEELMSACRIDLPFKDLDRSKAPRSLPAWRQWAMARLQYFAQVQDDAEVKVRNQKQLSRLKDLRDLDVDTWAWEASDQGWAFEPTIPRLLLPLLCDDIQTRVVFLSATVTAEALDLLGIDRKDVTFISYPSSFPVARRPVYVLAAPRVDVRTFKSTPEAEAYWLHTIATFARARRDRKGIIHTVSYARQRTIAEYLRREGYDDGTLYAPAGSVQLTRDIEAFRNAAPGAVLLSPSITTGIDLPYRDAEWQVIAKVPFPDTRSPIMQARVKANPGYAMQHVAQTIVQMAGRIMRAEDDQGETAIADAHFGWVWGKHKGLYAEWFNQAVRFETRMPAPLPRL